MPVVYDDLVATYDSGLYTYDGLVYVPYYPPEGYGSPLPYRQLLVAFQNGPRDDLTTFVVDPPGVTPSPGHWTDITLWAKGPYGISRGRQHEFAQFEAGTLQVRLRNSNGEFNTWIPGAYSGVTAGQFAPWLASARNGGTINTNGGLKVPVQVRDYVAAAQLLSVAQQAPGDTTGWTNANGITSYQGLSGALIFTASGVGDINSYTSNAGGVASAGGWQYTAQATFTAATTARTVQVWVQYYGSSGVLRTDSASAVDSTSGVTVNYSGTSPAGTTVIAMWLIVKSPASGEQHSVKNMSLRGPAIFRRYTGNATAWKPQWPDAMSKWALLQVADPLRYLNDQQLGNTGYSASIAAAATHYWRMNDPAGSSTVVDYCGFPYTTAAPLPGNLVAGGTGQSVLGSAGPLLANSASGSGALQFPSYNSAGTNSWVDVTGAGFAGSGGWSFVAWVKDNDISDGTVIVEQKPGGSGGWWNVAIGGGVVTALLANSAGIHAGLSSSYTQNVLDGNWHMVVVTYDGSTATLYLDGASVSTASVSGMGLVGTDGFYLGANDNSGATAFGGFTISEVATFGYGLSGTQVATFFQQGIGFVEQLTGQRIGACLSYLGLPANMQVLDGGNQFCQQNTEDLTQQTSLDHMQTRVERTEEGAFFPQGDGRLRFLSRQTLATSAPYAVPQCYFSDVVPANVLGFGVGVFGSTFGFSSGPLDIPIKVAPTLGLDDLDVVTGAICTRVGGLAKQYGSGAQTRMQTVSSVLHLTDACSAMHAQWIVAKEGVPVNRLSQFTVDLTAILGQPDLVAKVLAVDLLWMVSIYRTEVGFTETGLVEHISENTSADQWEITFSVSVTDAYPSWGWGSAQ